MLTPLVHSSPGCVRWTNSVSDNTAEDAQTTKAGLRTYTLQCWWLHTNRLGTLRIWQVGSSRTICSRQHSEFGHSTFDDYPVPPLQERACTIVYKLSEFLLTPQTGNPCKAHTLNSFRENCASLCAYAERMYCRVACTDNEMSEPGSEKSLFFLVGPSMGGSRISLNNTRLDLTCYL